MMNFHGFSLSAALHKAPVVRTKHGPMLSLGSYWLKITGGISPLLPPIDTSSGRKMVSVQRLISDRRKFSIRFPTQLSGKATSTWRRKLYQMAFLLQRDEICVISTCIVVWSFWSSALNSWEPFVTMQIPLPDGRKSGSRQGLSISSHHLSSQ